MNNKQVSSSAALCSKATLTAMASMAVYTQRGAVAALTYLSRCGYTREEAEDLMSLWDDYIAQVKLLCPTTKMH